MADGRPPRFEPTLSQTVGPFFHLGLGWLFNDEIDAPGAAGRRISVRGRVIDGDGMPVPDALLELWQPAARGRYPLAAARKSGPPAASILGYARVPTDEDGVFRFRTVKPGPLPAPGAATQAPHIAVHVFMRGLLRPLATRIYFADELSNQTDPVLACVPSIRRATLVATPVAGEPDAFEWNVVLQGPHETVFFDG
jgi:protocatechuate 3,4-dioxygenase alpha subunit